MTSLAAYVPWTTLRSVGNSHAVRLTVLIPLVGYLLIFNDTALRYLALAAPFGDPVAAPPPAPAPVPVRLLVTYFALCFLAVGSALYAWRCPQEIKHYPTAAAYTGGDGPHLSHFDYNYIDVVLREFYNEEFKRARSELSGQGAETIRNAKLKMYFQYLDTQHLKVRLATTFFFGLGFALLLSLSIQIFWRAVLILARSVL